MAWLVLAATVWSEHGCHGQSNQTEMPLSNQTEVPAANQTEMTQSNQTEVEQSTPTEVPQQGGGLLYFDAPVQEWETLIPTVRQGNGVFVSPDDALIVATSADGTMSAFDPSGTSLWTYGPPSIDSASAISCSSGITFAPDFLTYAVIADEESAAPSL
jgi:DNA-binding beta-propeller fold protein YncE